MPLDDIDRKAMREGQAVSRLKGYQGTRDRTRHEKIQLEKEDPKIKKDPK